MICRLQTTSALPSTRASRGGREGLNEAPPGLNRTMSVRTDAIVWLVFIFSAFAVGPALAESTVSVGVRRGSPGGTTPVPLSIRQAGGVTASQFDILFDPARVASGGVTLDSTGNHVVRSRELAPGVRRVLIYSLTSSSFPSNTLNATALFTVAANANTASIPLAATNLILATPNGAPVSPTRAAAGAIFLTPVRRTATGEVEFFLSSVIDQRYVVQASSDLVQWTTLSTNLATDIFVRAFDSAATNHSYRFYRALPAP